VLTHTKARAKTPTLTPVLFRIMPSTTLLPGGPRRFFASSPAKKRTDWDKEEGSSRRQAQHTVGYGKKRHNCVTAPQTARPGAGHTISHVGNRRSVDGLEHVSHLQLPDFLRWPSLRERFHHLFAARRSEAATHPRREQKMQVRTRPSPGIPWKTIPTPASFDRVVPGVPGLMPFRGAPCNRGGQG